jgi:glycosyltransferase involved in cell wall biosynthesis
MLGRLTSSHHFLRRVLRAIEYPINVLALLVYILAKRIKVVHCMWVVLPTIDFFTIRILRFAGCRVVYTAHNPFPHEFKASHLKKYSRIYRQVDHIIALTNFTRNQIVKHAKISTEKISVIPHGDFNYVLSQYPCNEALAEKVRRLAGDKRVITFIGAIRPYKGLEYFIKAFELIKRLKSNTFFLIAGSTRFANQKQLERLLSASCDPRDRYVDLSHFPVSDLKAYLAVTDVMVLPYVSGASQSANTVMAYVAGIPVISTNVGGLAEMVEDGKTGYVIAPQDPEAIADAVAKCFDGDNYEKMSHNARLAAAEQYSWGKIAEETAAVYQRFENSTEKS